MEIGQYGNYLVKKILSIFKRPSAKNQSGSSYAIERYQKLASRYESVLRDGSVDTHLRSVLTGQLSKVMNLVGMSPKDDAWLVSVNAHLDLMSLTLTQMGLPIEASNIHPLSRLRSSLFNQGGEKVDEKAEESTSLEARQENKSAIKMTPDERKSITNKLTEYSKKSAGLEFEGKEHLDEEIDILLKLLKEADEADEAEKEGRTEAPEKKSRRDFLTQASVVGVASAMILAPSTARAGWFGEEAAAIIAALWQFASKLWDAMNNSVDMINGMMSSIGEGLGALENKLQFGFEAGIEASTVQNDKLIVSLGSVGDKLTEQMVANERTRVVQAAQPSSGVCGDDILNASSGTTKKLVDQQTLTTNEIGVINETVPPASDSDKNNKEAVRQEFVNRIVQPNANVSDPNQWNTNGLNYTASFSPSAITKPANYQRDSETFVHFVSQGLPNDGMDALDADYLKTGNSAYPTMVYQRAARSSVARGVLERHRSEELPDAQIAAQTVAHLQNNVDVQRAALNRVRQEQASGGNGTTSQDVSVNQGRLALSEQILQKVQNERSQISSGSNQSGISYRRMEQLKVERWTGPEYHAYLNVTGPEPAPLLRDLIKQNGTALEMQKAILDELRQLNDLTSTLLLETIDANPARKDEFNKIRSSART